MRRDWRRWGTLLLLLALAAGATAVYAVTSSYFGNANATAGINFKHIKQTGYWGVGQAWGDADGDGWLDVYLTDQVKGNVLYLNNGDGTFNLSGLSSINLLGIPSGGAVFADYDNDGDADLYALNKGANALFRNDLVETGNLEFTDVTATAGVGDIGKGQTAAWGDYDEDGDLDLYVANWYCKDGDDTFCDLNPAIPFDGNADVLYRNNGDGTFTDVSGWLDYNSRLGAGFVGSFVDYDNDGDLDIYVVNDMFANPIGNVMWRNDGSGTNCGLTASDWCFVEVAGTIGADTTLCGMGLAIGDYDNDLDLDFYFSNAPSCGDGVHHLLQNQTSQGSATFVDVSAAAGVDIGGVGWGTVFGDFNNDSHADLFLARSGNPGNPPGETYYSVLYFNNADGTFTNAGSASGADMPAQGLAYADYDEDGWLDIMTGPFNGNYTLSHNLGLTGTTAAHNWVSLQLLGDPGAGVNADAIGARLYLTTTLGVRMQEVKSGSSLGAGNQLALHFGLGPMVAETAVTGARVVWPDGSEQTAGPLASNVRYTWAQGGSPTPDTPPTAVTLHSTGAERPPAAILPLLAALLAGLTLFTRRRFTRQ